MSKDTINRNERRSVDYRALIDERGLSYNQLAIKVQGLIGEFVSGSTVYRAANPNDKYENPKILNALTIILGGKMTQWERLLEYLESGNSITVFGCYEILGFTQLHGRLFEIQRKTEYEICEESPSNISKVIFWKWEESRNARFKRYWIPQKETLF